MSLQTIIEIGKKIRQSDQALSYHRYVKKATSVKDFKEYKVLNFSVDTEFNIDFDSKEIVENDNLKEKFYFLKFRTGEADTYVKYIFGDFCSDYFKLADSSKKANSLYSKDSFERGITDAEKIGLVEINKFRNSLDKILNDILNELEAEENWYVHFSFQNKHWYQLTEIYEKINEAILQNFIKEEDGNLSLDSFLTRTLIGSASRLTDFDEKNTFKNKRFKNIEEVKDLLFGLDFHLKYKLREDNIFINLLPKGNIEAEDIINYFANKDLSFTIEQEEENETDSYLAPALSHNIKNIIRYDILFSKDSKPIGVDLIEINDVGKNQLNEVQKKISAIKERMQKQGFNTKFLGIKSALKNLFEKEKFKNHLLRVLPKIYQNSYYEDPFLLPTLLQKAELYTRSPERYPSKKKNLDGFYPYQNLRKYFYFLSNLQKNNNLMKLKESPSFVMGKHLGILAKPFASWRDNCPIKTFEKNYVGQLSKKINDLDSLNKFTYYLMEKLTMHERNYKNQKESYQSLINTLKDLEPKNYNNSECALGFFESYYQYIKKEEETIETENQQF